MARQGDIVVLKSGGPRMTVTSRGADDKGFVFCRWFDEGGQLQGNKFPIEALLNEGDR